MLDLPENQDPFPDNGIDCSGARQLCSLWIFRMLYRCGGLKNFLGNPMIHDDLLPYVGLNEEQMEKFKKAEIKLLLKERFATLDEIKIRRRSNFFKNIKLVKSEFRLSKVDAEILTFASLIRIDEAFGRCFDVLGSLSNGRLYATLADTLGLPKNKVIQALHKDGLLFRSGLIKVCGLNKDMDGKLEMLNGLCNSLELQQDAIMPLFSSYITSAPLARLQLGDFDYIQGDYLRLARYLEETCKKEVKGANVLLYGKPGTGKTELVRSLARETGLQLFEISVEDIDGDTLSGKQRITACQLAQTLLRNKQDCCLLFDEIEDLFPNDFFALLAGEKQSGKDKAWVNQLLEKNETPTFWITNSISSLDNAFVRRFDYVIELKVPPRQARRRILTETLAGKKVSPQWIERMSSIESLPPAVVERAARTSCIIGEDEQNTLEASLERMIGNTLNAMGISDQTHQSLVKDVYDPSLLQTSGDIGKISKGLGKSRQGRLCFYGPPGTGKSAYAEHLAEILEMPLIANQASNLLDCYVGNTEKNIARMFERARDEKGVLLLDEADSFLRDRSQSRNSWEVTQVNELLVQMEKYQGIFVCSTNLMENLDSAVLRRFDFKLKFDYLPTNQAWRLFCRYLDGLEKKGKSGKCEAIKTQLGQMKNLTPGDFAAVGRKLTVLGTTDQPEEFLRALQEEISFKRGGIARPIGFHAGF